MRRPARLAARAHGRPATRRSIRAAALASALTLTAGGCAAAGGTDTTDDDDLVRVVAAFYPLQYVAEQVGGDRAAVTGLAPPGVEAHDLELSPSQVLQIAEADLVIYLSDFQPAVDAAVAEHARGALDVAEVVPLIATADDHGDDDHGDDDHADDDHADGDGHADEDSRAEGDHGHGPDDLHVWLDPERLATIADEVAAQLSALDPAHAQGYADRSGQLGTELSALDTAYAEGLADCERREIVVSHAAFGYLAERYDLTQIAIGLSPEDEPTPQRMAEVAREAGEHGATTIFFEVLVSSRVADVIADHVGAETAVLDPIEGLAPDHDADYLSLMRANLDALRAGLGCT